MSRREFTKTYPLFIELIEAGITICTTADDRVYNAANANDLEIVLLTMVKMMTGNQESAKKAKRLIDLWDERRKIGFKSAVCPAWIRLTKDGIYDGIPERVPTVRRIFDLAETGLGAVSIAKILNADPTTPPFAHKHGKKGQKWHATTIHNILTGRAVLGEYQAHKIADGVRVPVGEVDPNRYPQIISEGQWQRVQDRCKTNPQGKRDDEMSNLFQGIIFCGQCGGPMRVKTSFLSKKRTSGRNHRYFVCSNAMLKNGCEARTYFPLEGVENAILDNTDEYRLHEIFADPRLAEELKGVENGIAAHNAEISDLERRKANLTARIANLEPDDPLSLEWEATIRGYLADIKVTRDTVKALEQRCLSLSSRIDQRTDAEGNVKALRAQMMAASGGDLLVLRAKLSDALKTFITHVRFFPRDNGFTVNLEGIMRSHQFGLVNGKGRSAGRKVEYYGAINFGNDEMHQILGLPRKLC